MPTGLSDEFPFTCGAPKAHGSARGGHFEPRLVGLSPRGAPRGFLSVGEPEDTRPAAGRQEAAQKLSWRSHGGWQHPMLPAPTPTGPYLQLQPGGGLRAHPVAAGASQSLGAEGPIADRPITDEVQQVLVAREGDRRRTLRMMAAVYFGPDGLSNVLQELCVCGWGVPADLIAVVILRRVPV